jgi:hypothetical protein
MIFVISAILSTFSTCHFIIFVLANITRFSHSKFKSVFVHFKAIVSHHLALFSLSFAMKLSLLKSHTTCLDSGFFISTLDTTFTSESSQKTSLKSSEDISVFFLFSIFFVAPCS